MYDRIVEIISDHLDIDVEEISEDSHIINDLKADSLDIVELIMKIEDELSIEIPEDSVADLDTVGDIIDYLENL